MYRYRSAIRSRKLTSLWRARIILSLLVLFSITSNIFAQEIQRTLPTWWFGAAEAVNLNFYGGTTQVLNPSFTTPSAFHKGFGLGLYLAPFVEYRPDSVWGVILQAAYDDRRGSFNDVPCPCGQNSSLAATASYLSIEPSLRFAPWSNALYFFGGPRIGFSWAPTKGDEKTFVYTQAGNYANKGQFSDMKGTVFSGQIGVGYDIPLKSPNARHQIDISPFLSFQPFMGENPRSVETWGVSTLRLGASIKFGSGKEIARAEVMPAPAVVEREVDFSVRAPKAVPLKRRVRESFPILNCVFFEEGSSEIPSRYVVMTKDQAANFQESQLQDVRPLNMTGRSLRQMTVYYNILNIIGIRMRRSPAVVINLTGASGLGPNLAKERAEAIKRYLVDVFGIDGSRITTEGRDKPRTPSEVPGATKELTLLRAEDRRVDIDSDSPEMTIEVGGGPHYMLKPVQIVAEVEDPLDSHLLINVVGAKDVFSSWSLEITDEQGKVQRFGPSTQDHENISGNTILGDRAQGDYTIVLLGQTKSGKFVKKQTTVHLIRRDEPVKEAVRFSILFEFDQSKTIASYEKFLTDVVTPLIPDTSLVIIHGHTDIVGTEEYNDSLSSRRVEDARAIIEGAIAKSGKHGITFQTFGFGENLQYAPFDNNFPEERFYNITVIIDIVPD